MPPTLAFCLRPRDVLAGLHRLVLVVEGEHALEEEGGGVSSPTIGSVMEISFAPASRTTGASPPVIDSVARPAGEGPDDYVVDAGGRGGCALQLIEHLQEVGALVQVDEGAPAGVAELATISASRLHRLVFSALALGVDGQAIVGVVGLDLAVG